MTQQQSPEQVARQQLEQEDEQRRRSRLDQLTREEAQRRQREKEESDKEARRAEAAECAEKLGARRSELEAKIEEQAESLNETLGDLQKLDSEHRSAMRQAGIFGDHSLHHQPLSRSVDTFLKNAFTGFLDQPRARNPRRLTTLDPLTYSPGLRSAVLLHRACPALASRTPRARMRRLSWKSSTSAPESSGPSTGGVSR